MLTPKSLGLAHIRESRLCEVNNPDTAILTQFVLKMRSELGDKFSIPYFDPFDGAKNAACLFLLEAPGGKAKMSGFISRDNPDETAKNIFELCMSADLPRKSTIIWNIVPWYVGDSDKIRPVTIKDIKQAEPYLVELLTHLPQLKSIILFGRKSQKAFKTLSKIAPHFEIYHCWHPSPLSLNGHPERREHTLQTLKKISACRAD